MREFGLLLDPDWQYFFTFCFVWFFLLFFVVFVSFFLAWSFVLYCFLFFFDFYLSLTSSYLLWVLRNRDHSWKLTTYIQSYFAMCDSPASTETNIIIKKMGLMATRHLFKIMK